MAPEVLSIVWFIVWGVAILVGLGVAVWIVVAALAVKHAKQFGPR